jgi:hypothetical protein
MTLVACWAVAIAVILWVWNRVAYHDDVLDATADDAMWSVSLETYTNRASR